jgi:hypothetical protein
MLPFWVVTRTDLEDRRNNKNYKYKLLLFLNGDPFPNLLAFSVTTYL